MRRNTHQRFLLKYERTPKNEELILAKDESVLYHFNYDRLRFWTEIYFLRLTV